MAVAKKHLKRAVDRNRVKRVIRESFRLKHHNLAKVDVVVLVKRGIEANEKRGLRSSLETLWRDLNRKCEKLSSD